MPGNPNYPTMPSTTKKKYVPAKKKSSGKKKVLSQSGKNHVQSLWVNQRS